MSCINAVREVLRSSQMKCTAHDVHDALRRTYSLETVKESLRLLEFSGEIECVGKDGPNKRSKIYQWKDTP